MSEITPPRDVEPARLRTDVFLTFAGKGVTLLLGLATAVVIARRLGPSGQGIFAVAYTLTLMLVQVGGLGLTAANTFFTARSPGQVPKIIGNALWLAGLLGFALGCAGVLIKLAFPGVVEGLDWAPLLVTLAGVPGALAALFLQSVLLGAGRMVAYNSVEVTQAGATLAALLVAYAFADLQLTGTLAILGLGRYGAAFAYVVLLAQRSRIAGRLDTGLARSMLGYGFRVYVAILVSFLVIRVDLLLVNAYLGRTEAGLYSIAATLADGMFVLPTVVALNLFPRVARGDPTNASAEVFRSIAVLYGLFCLATVPIAGVAIRAFFGSEFDGATSLYYWLLPGIYSLGMLTILSHHFAGRGFPRLAMAFWIVGLGINLVLNFAFLPGRGAWVAALASSITYTVLLALFMWLFAREAGGFGAMRPRPGEVVRFVRVAVSRS